MKLGAYELDSIITGDARELSKGIPDESVDLIFTDPPYFVGFVYGSGQSDKEMPLIDPYDLVQECRRIARVTLITPGIANMYEYPKPDWIHGWFKPGSTRRSAVLNGFNTWEPVLIYGKPTKRVYQDSSYLPTVSNLNDTSANFHGCPKPLNLLRNLIQMFTEPNDIVLDLMAGSGTTCIAARELNCRYLGFEIDPTTADLARERVANAQPLLNFQHEQLRLIS